MAGQATKYSSLFTNIVLHMINRFGIKDIMDYDIQRILYQEFSSGTSKENRTVSNQNEEADNEEAEKVAAKSLNNPDPKKDRDKENQDDDNDLYKNVDINNLF